MLDRLLGEPPAPVHPVVLFGRAMEITERMIYRDTWLAGAAHAAVGAALGVGAGALAPSTALATVLAVGGRGLARAALEVSGALAASDEVRARELLPALVGRDPTGLDAAEIARATVESVAENTVDAVVAPALWGALAGAPGALGYRAINTMDAMVGHRSPRYVHYGSVSARLDDLANWVPARCTAALVAMVRPGSAREVRLAVSTQAPAHPSPNSGVAEAAFAAALGIRLGGTNRYGERSEVRPPLGWGRGAQPADIVRAVRLSRDVATALAVALGLAGAVQWWRGR
ncbi:MAG: adenosylcobinamide-phosphate synthase CbiB [Acidimicrobiales bacterium]